MSESSLAIEAHGSVKRFPRAQGWGELVRMALEKAVDEGAARMNLLIFERNRAAVNLLKTAPLLCPDVHGLRKSRADRGPAPGRHRLGVSKAICKLDGLIIFDLDWNYVLAYVLNLLTSLLIWGIILMGVAPPALPLPFPRDLSGERR